MRVVLDLAEATFNHLAPTGWKAMSMGSQPAGTVHPLSLALLACEGIDTDGLHSKSWDNLPYLAVSHRGLPRVVVGATGARPHTLEGGTGSDWGTLRRLFWTDICIVDGEFK